MKLKKALLACCVAAITASCLFALAGCGGNKSDEDIIREGITTELEAIKSMDQEFVDTLVADSGSSDFAAYGIDVTEFMKGYLDGFDYSVDTIEVAEDGNTATVIVTLTCKSFAGFMEQVQTDSTEWAANIDSAASMTNEDINAAVGGIIMDALGKVESVTTDPISVTYEKVDGSWQAAAGTEDVISAGLLSN